MWNCLRTSNKWTNCIVLLIEWPCKKATPYDSRVNRCVKKKMNSVHTNNSHCSHAVSVNFTEFMKKREFRLHQIVLFMSRIMHYAQTHKKSDAIENITSTECDCKLISTFLGMYAERDRFARIDNYLWHKPIRPLAFVLLQYNCETSQLVCGLKL